jgi:uncharacterized protein (DUF302 family)
METSSKTAEKAKHFIDQVDAKIQVYDHEIQQVVAKYKEKYHEEVEELRHQIEETKNEVKVKQEERLQQVKDAYHRMKSESQSLSEAHLEPIKQKMVEIKADSISYSDEVGRKLQDVKHEIQELLEKTKQAVTKFRDTDKILMGKPLHESRMKYYYSKTLSQLSFEEAISRITAELKQEGFGVLTDIDIKATLKEKLGVDFYNYRILGACNPPSAYKALQAEDKVGTMLPCNVIVQEKNKGTIEISAIDPLASMQAIRNQSLSEIAEEIRDKLIRAVDKAATSN